MGGFDLISNALSKIMSPFTAAPLMSLTSSIMSLFTAGSLVVQSFIPTVPGICVNVTGVNPVVLTLSIAAGACASCIGPLSVAGAFISSSVSQTYDEKYANKLFGKGMGIAMLAAIIIALVSATGVYYLFA